MKVATISSKGQIAIPKEVRDALHVETGDRFTVEVSGNNIILRPAVTLTIPKEQAYFWAQEVQEKLQSAERNFKKGRAKDYSPDAFVKELEKRR
ncbi:MAG TPA: AbrB/MazE/SpoVT family DNA-binding domain-containing protein [bacterium]|nr:AbrB/MazE/SpoVT family DNA-binding domain-containing protein [bacterium]